MNKYPTVPTALPSPIQDDISQIIANLESHKISIYEYRPKNRGSLVATQTPNALRKLADDLEAYEIEKSESAAWRMAAQEYNAAIDQVIEDAVKHFADLKNVPEQYRPKVWAKAWADGHSGGWMEVHNCLCELVDLFA